MVFLDERRGDGRDETLLDRVRRAVWEMLYADDAGIVSRSPAGLARVMTAIVEVFGAFGLTVSEKKMETLLMWAPEKTQQSGDTYTTSTGAGDRSSRPEVRPGPPVRYLSGLVTEDADITRDINRRTKIAWGCFRKFSAELFGRPSAPLRLKSSVAEGGGHGGSAVRVRDVGSA